VHAPLMYRKTFPPEVLSTACAGFQSDVYLLGLLLYRCVNGETHFDVQDQKFQTDAEREQAIIKGRFPDRTAFLPHIPAQMQRVIRKALKVSLTERFESATAMLDAWARIKLDRNWSFTPCPSGDYAWLGTASGKCDLRVVLKTRSATMACRSLLVGPYGSCEEMPGFLESIRRSDSGDGTP
jgi:eukaryotic-like serine/threonine-protein kinase